MKKSVAQILPCTLKYTWIVSLKVPAQPLCYYNKQGKLTRYNLRKFSELPFQLVRCYRYKVLGLFALKCTSFCETRNSTF
jgi:hypothetical protein